MLHVLWDRTLGERLEVEQASIAPPLAVAGLDAELALHLLETLSIDVGLYGIPDSEETTGFVNTVIILVTELVSEGAAALHLMIPGYMMEPSQQVLGTGVDVVVETAKFVGILLNIG